MYVLLAIHQPDLRVAIELFLREEASINVVGSVSNTDGLEALLHVTGPDLLLLDWSLPGCPLPDLLADIHATDAPPKVIVLSDNENDKETVLAAGANFFVVKGEPPQYLLATIRQLDTGRGNY